MTDPAEMQARLRWLLENRATPGVAVNLDARRPGEWTLRGLLTEIEKYLAND